ncbi:MAG: TMEM165/GDT1 family protein [Chlamydiota bacterium]|nr:TMEM165/GDT1 family protein [Chlamydiota bacterium]
MDLRLFFTVFATVFLAEIADKTQLATMLYATNHADQKYVVFFGAALALVVSAAIGVALGSLIGRIIPMKFISWTAGVGFIIVGIWTILKSAS